MTAGKFVFVKQFPEILEARLDPLPTNCVVHEAQYTKETQLVNISIEQWACALLDTRPEEDPPSCLRAGLLKQALTAFCLETRLDVASKSKVSPRSRNPSNSLKITRNAHTQVNKEGVSSYRLFFHNKLPNIFITRKCTIWKRDIIIFEKIFVEI